MIHGRVLRSPHAHARITRIDVSAALAMDGVFAAICGKDFQDIHDASAVGGEGGGTVEDAAKNVMARDKVLYHGHAVAAVAASNPLLAEAALEASRG